MSAIAVTRGSCDTVQQRSGETTVMLKALILFLLVGVLVSLFSGLVFLFRDSDRRDSKRTLYALGIRVTLAGALLIAVFYGFYTGQLRLGTNAPWHAERHGSEMRSE